MKIHVRNTKNCNKENFLIKIRPEYHISCSSRISTCPRVSYSEYYSSHSDLREPTSKECTSRKWWRNMIYEICRCSIDTSCEFKNFYIWIKDISFKFFFRTRSSSRGRKCDKSISLFYFDVHMSM